MTISREKCLEWADDLINKAPRVLLWIDDIEALINRAYAEGQKDMREEMLKWKARAEFSYKERDRLAAENAELVKALEQITNIEDEMYGGDWDEIGQARLIARAALAEHKEAGQLDLGKCPQCGGPADNGYDRGVPPSPYFCKACTK